MKLPTVIPILLAFAGAARAELPAGANAYCPVTREEPVDERYHTDYEGRVIYFCCDKCRRKFLVNPAEYADAPAVAPAHATHGRSDREGGLGLLHPIAVHFPIALIIAAGAAELMSVVRRQSSWSTTGRHCVTLGAIGAVLAVPLGWLAAGPPGADALTEWHRWLGVATLAGSASAAILARTPCRRAYRAMLCASVAAVAAAGHLGGLLTHGPLTFSLQ